MTQISSQSRSSGSRQKRLSTSHLILASAPRRISGVQCTKICSRSMAGKIQPRWPLHSEYEDPDVLSQMQPAATPAPIIWLPLSARNGLPFKAKAHRVAAYWFRILASADQFKAQEPPFDEAFALVSREARASFILDSGLPISCVRSMQSECSGSLPSSHASPRVQAITSEPRSLSAVH